MNAEITSEFMRFPGVLRLLEIRRYGIKNGGMRLVTLGLAYMALTTIVQTG